MSLHLTAHEEGLLKGAGGPAQQFAMGLVVKAAKILNAPHLVQIGFSHLDSCFYIGRAHLDFANRLRDMGARFPSRTWTNASLHSSACPLLRNRTQDQHQLSEAAQLMLLYEALGAKPTFTCAPYDLPGGPAFSDHIVVGESNAVSYYNSVLGCRTNKYGDYLDVACALVGRAPFAGLHTDQARRATFHMDCSALPDAIQQDDRFPHLLGFIMGGTAGANVPIITGLRTKLSAEALKAICSAGATSGGVELWHGVGQTPEAQDFDTCFAGGNRRDVSIENLKTANRQLTSAADGPITAVALGTPHFSMAEFERLRTLLADRKIALGLTMIITTGRAIRQELADKGWLQDFIAQGLTIANDVCTYYNPVVGALTGRVMTNAAKWAYYAPGMIGAEVVFGSLVECVESAISGEVWRQPQSWLL
jgi:predicted aconitase